MRPFDRARALFDPLFPDAELVIEADDILGWPRHVGDDEADARVKCARAPVDLGDVRTDRRSLDEGNGFVIHTSLPTGAEATQKVHICEASLVVWANVSAANNTTGRRVDVKENSLSQGSSLKVGGTHGITEAEARRPLSGTCAGEC